MQGNTINSFMPSQYKNINNTNWLFIEVFGRREKKIALLVHCKIRKLEPIQLKRSFNQKSRMEIGPLCNSAASILLLLLSTNYTYTKYHSLYWNICHSCYNHRFDSRDIVCISFTNVFAYEKIDSSYNDNNKQML